MIIITTILKAIGYAYAIRWICAAIKPYFGMRQEGIANMTYKLTQTPFGRVCLIGAGIFGLISPISVAISAGITYILNLALGNLGTARR